MGKYIQELLKRKDLLVYLVLSGLKAQYRNSFLGYLWWLLDPLLGVMIYYFLVVVVLNRGGPNFGVYLVIGMIAWRWISSTVNSSVKSIVSQSGIISKVYLPKAIFPLGVSLTQLINFSIGLIIIAVFLAIFRIAPGLEVLWLPVIMAVQIIFLLAVSLVLAYMSVFIRDMDNLTTHFMRLWFYASPVIWEREWLEKYQWLINLNPVSTFLEGYRNIFMHQAGPDLFKLSVLGLISLLIVVFIIFYYSKNEHRIIKVL